MAKTEAEIAAEAAAAGGADEPVIPGTTYKTIEEAAKGISELKAFNDKQGNELGTTKAQLEQANQSIAAMSPSAKAEAEAKAAEKAAATPDYEGQLAEIDTAIEKLDVDDPTYTKDVNALNRQARTIERERAKTETQVAMNSQFEKHLKSQNAATSETNWRAANPAFDAPEMQEAINQHMANDTFGIQDPVLAYREIQLAEAQKQSAALAEQNEEFRVRLKLKSGEEKVGVVTTENGGTPAVTKPAKVTGEELDAGMSAAFQGAG